MDLLKYSIKLKFDCLYENCWFDSHFEELFLIEWKVQKYTLQLKTTSLCQPCKLHVLWSWKKITNSEICLELEFTSFSIHTVQKIERHKHSIFLQRIIHFVRPSICIKYYYSFNWYLIASRCIPHIVRQAEGIWEPSVESLRSLTTKTYDLPERGK